MPDNTCLEITYGMTYGNRIGENPRHTKLEFLTNTLEIGLKGDLNYSEKIKNALFLIHLDLCTEVHVL